MNKDKRPKNCGYAMFFKVGNRWVCINGTNASNRGTVMKRYFNKSTDISPQKAYNKQKKDDNLLILPIFQNQ